MTTATHQKQSPKTGWHSSPKGLVNAENVCIDKVSGGWWGHTQPIDTTKPARFYVVEYRNKGPAHRESLDAWREYAYTPEGGWRRGDIVEDPEL